MFCAGIGNSVLMHDTICAQYVNGKKNTFKEKAGKILALALPEEDKRYHGTPMTHSE